MNTLLKILVALFAIGLSASAAYFSVLGLTKMYAGAVLGTAIVCSFIEGSKLIIASVLHQFNKQLNWMIKSLLVIFLVFAMAITSMGVYGYLTNAFQSTANQLQAIEGQTKVLDMKRTRFQESLDSYKLEKEQLANSISELSKGLSNNVIEYKDKQTGEIIRTTSSATRKALESQLNDSKVERDKVTLKVEALTDSITNLDLSILNLNSNEDLAAEIGPLKFITELTGLEMNQVINFLTLILVIIIDPLAIVLVIVFNNITKPTKSNDNVIDTADTWKKVKELKQDGKLPDVELNKEPSALAFSYHDEEHTNPDDDLKWGPEYTKIMEGLRDESTESNDIKLASQNDTHPETRAKQRYNELMFDIDNEEADFYGENHGSRPKRVG